ncbi:MAG: hypothetical protein WCG92_07175 [Hyphomicrobiales bacterium]|nr:hypothetical protein [Alphaproteobacteria bacterium]
MSKNKSQAWNTKYGPRRVRSEAPTLAEAIDAAQGLSDDIDAQANIAGSLMGLPSEQVLAELLKLAPPRKDVSKTFAFVGTADAPRTVVVERKTSRRIIPAADRAALKRTGVISLGERSSRTLSRQPN